MIGAGMNKQLLSSGQLITFGPAATSFGQVKIIIEPLTTPETTSHRIRWQADWHSEAPLIEVRLPGQSILRPTPADNYVICGYSA